MRYNERIMRAKESLGKQDSIKKTKSTRLKPGYRSESKDGKERSE